MKSTPMRIGKINHSHHDAKHLKVRKLPDPPKYYLDYSKFVVNKPWGYEYLMYANDTVELWNLYLKKGAMTSMHCHPRKKTALIILEGKAQFSSLTETYTLKQFDSCVIDPATFHQTKAISPGGIRIVEVESPPMKWDIIRLRDAYGREREPYEGVDKMTLDEGECIRFPDPRMYECQERVLRNCVFRVKKIKGQYDALDEKHFYNHDLLTILSGEIKHRNGKVLHTVGDVIDAATFTRDLHLHSIDDVTMLFLKNGI